MGDTCISQIKCKKVNIPSNQNREFLPIQMAIQIGFSQDTARIRKRYCCDEMLMYVALLCHIIITRAVNWDSRVQGRLVSLSPLQRTRQNELQTSEKSSNTNKESIVEATDTSLGTEHCLFSRINSC